MRLLAARREFYDRLLERVRATPGVRSAALSTHIPLEGGSNGYITVPGQDDCRAQEAAVRVELRVARLLPGVRDPDASRGGRFDAQRRGPGGGCRGEDRRGCPPARRVVRRAAGHARGPPSSAGTMARLVWPNEDPIGRTFIYRRRDSGRGDRRGRRRQGAGHPRGGRAAGLLPVSRARSTTPGRSLLTVKAAGDPLALLPAIRRHVGALDSTLAVIEVRGRWTTSSRTAWRTRRLQAWLLGIVRRARGGPGRGRALQRDGVPRRPAAARTRHPDRARRRPAPDPPAGAGARRDGRRRGADRRPRRGAVG